MNPDSYFFNCVIPVDYTFPPRLDLPDFMSSPIYPLIFKDGEPKPIKARITAMKDNRGQAFIVEWIYQ